MSNDDLTRAISESRQLEPTTPPVAQAATDATIDLGASVTTDSPLAGRVGSFKILRLLGRGGMGAVYLAVQDQPRRQVALKVMRDERLSDDLLRRFLHESALLARLQHPGIAQIFEAGTAESSGRKLPYFAMEFVEGRTLTEYVEGHKLPTADRLKVLVKICEAVEHAHQKGIIHRDLKPGNILVDTSGQPKILDFGIARATDADVQAVTMATSVGQGAYAARRLGEAGTRQHGHARLSLHQRV